MKITEIQRGTLGLVRIPVGPNPWRLTITDPDSKDVIWVDLSEDVAKQIAEKLNSGVVIAKAIPKQ